MLIISKLFYFMMYYSNVYWNPKFEEVFNGFIKQIAEVLPSLFREDFSNISTIERWTILNAMWKGIIFYRHPY